MSPSLAFPTSLALVLLALVSACKDGKGSCRVDADCPESNLCRDDVCAATQLDAGGPVAFDDGGSGVSTCASEGTTCGSNGDCCTGICTNGICASATSPPSCIGLSGLCQDDCCAGYACIKGVCQ